MPIGFLSARFVQRPLGATPAESCNDGVRQDQKASSKSPPSHEGHPMPKSLRVRQLLLHSAPSWRALRFVLAKYLVTPTVLSGLNAKL